MTQKVDAPTSIMLNVGYHRCEVHDHGLFSATALRLQDGQIGQATAASPFEACVEALRSVHLRDAKKAQKNEAVDRHLERLGQTMNDATKHYDESLHETRKNIRTIAQGLAELNERVSAHHRTIQTLADDSRRIMPEKTKRKSTRTTVASMKAKKKKKKAGRR